MKKGCNYEPYEVPKVPKDYLRYATCDNCIHLYYNNDGSTACDSSYEKPCLKSNDRKFKETAVRLHLFRDSMEFVRHYKEAETIAEKVQCFIAKVLKAHVVTPLGRIVLLPKDYDQLFKMYICFPFVSKE